MGTWDETCALTGTPIFEREPVVAVRLERSGFLGGERAGAPFGLYVTDFAAVREVIRTTYAGYGLPQGRAGDEIEAAGEAWLFFQPFAWDAALGEQPEPTAAERGLLKVMANLPVRGVQFYRVARFALRVRRDIRSVLAFQGGTFDERDVSAYRVLVEEIERCRPLHPVR